MFTSVTTAVAGVALAASLGFAQSAPVNALCPVGKEPIVASAGTVEHGGNTVGLCCPGCGKQFLAWSTERKDAFITAALNQQEGSDAEEREGEPARAHWTADGPTYPYTLDACPVGGKLGSMGEPVVRVYDNREVRFCCAGCIETFEADKAKYWSEIDEKTVRQQLMHYPLDTCIVTREKLGPDAVNHVHNNRLVRLANDEAAKRFKAKPAEYLTALDKQIIEAQLADYPMDTCPVGGKLGSMGEPVNFIYMNRLVRFCCGGCEATLVAEPAKYMAKLDAAYAAKQRDDYAPDTCVVSGEPLGSMGDPVEVVAGTRLVKLCCKSCLPEFQKTPQKCLSKLPQE